MIKYFECDSNGRKIRGLCHEYSSNAPIVAIVHGFFSANKIGPYRLFFEIAQSLSNVGFNVLRFDLSAMGESDGNIYNISFSDHVCDLINVIDQLKCIYSQNKISLLAHCGGSSVVISYAKDYFDNIDKMTLISPFLPCKESLGKLFDDNMLIDLKFKGYTYRKGIYFHSSFLEGLYNLWSDFTNISCEFPIDVIYGDNDEFVSAERYRFWTEKNRLNNSMICNADHNYLNRLARNELLKLVNSIYI